MDEYLQKKNLSFWILFYLNINKHKTYLLLRRRFFRSEEEKKIGFFFCFSPAYSYLCRRKGVNSYS